MSKVKIFIVALLLALYLTGCQSSEPIPEGYYDYDKEKVEGAIKELSFQPEVPNFVPIEVDFLIYDQYQVQDNGAEALDISFYTRHNDLLSIQFIHGDMEEVMIQPEKVQIDQDVEGLYVDNSYAKTLFWEKENISYKLIYRSSTVEENEVSKIELLEVAQSFHS